MKRLTLAAILLTISSGCSINRITANTTAGLFGEAAKSFYEETDLVLARDSLPATLKILEGILRASPDNSKLLTLLAQGYCSYALAFLEDSENKSDIDRARVLYWRGYQYGLRMLSTETRASASGDLDIFQQEIEKEDDAAALFWTSYCLGNWVNLSKTEVNAIAELSRAENIMRRVMKLDPNFYYGSVHTFYGVYYGSRPKMLGGNPEKAREHFEKAIEISGGKFLLPKVFLAQFAAVPLQDEALFDKALAEVKAAPTDLLPEEALANQVAKKRALKLEARKKELF